MIENINELDIANSNNFLVIIIFAYIDNNYNFVIIIKPIKKFVLHSL